MADRDTRPTNPRGLTGSHTLPDYRPRGMGKGDKICMWILIFIVVLFGLGTFTQHMNSNSTSGAHPQPTVTKTVNAKGQEVVGKNNLQILLDSQAKWYIDAYASLHHVSEQSAALTLIRAGVQAQK